MNQKMQKIKKIHEFEQIIFCISLTRSLNMRQNLMLNKFLLHNNVILSVLL